MTDVRAADLVLSEEVDIIVLLQGLGHPVDKDLSEPLVRLQPCRVETQAKRGSIRQVVSLEVVSDHPSELVLIIDV